MADEEFRTLSGAGEEPASSLPAAENPADGGGQAEAGKEVGSAAVPAETENAPECTEAACSEPNQTSETAPAAEEASAAAVSSLPAAENPADGGGQAEGTEKTADAPVRFAASFIPTKRNYRDFGRIHMKRTHISPVLVIIAVILYAGAIALRAVFDSEAALALGAFSWILLFYALFFGYFLGNSAYRSTRGQRRDMPVHYEFGEDGIAVQSELESAMLQYSGISQVCEGNLVYALYLARNQAIVIPKVAFTEGTSDGFGEFIAEKTGCPYRYYRTHARTALRIAVAAVLLIAMMAGLILPFLSGSGGMRRYTVNGMSVMLPESFVQQADENYDFYASNTECGVYAYSVGKDELAAAYGQSISLEQFAAMLAYYNGVEDSNTTIAEDGSCRMIYSRQIGDAQYDFYDVAAEGSSDYWEIIFVCYSNQADRYMPLFAQWADTMVIE